MQTDHLISARWPDLVIVNSKDNLPNSGLCCPGKLKECEKKDKYLDLARELKKTMEHEGDNDTNCD